MRTRGVVDDAGLGENPEGGSQRNRSGPLTDGCRGSQGSDAEAQPTSERLWTQWDLSLSPFMASSSRDNWDLLELK